MTRVTVGWRGPGDYKGPHPYRRLTLTLATSKVHLPTDPMTTRVQTAIDVKKAIKGASELTKIGFDASVLEDAYLEIKDTIETYGGDNLLPPDPDENTLAVPGGGKIDKTQMVRHRRVVTLRVPNSVSRGLQESLEISASRITTGIRIGWRRVYIRSGSPGRHVTSTVYSTETSKMSYPSGTRTRLRLDLATSRHKKPRSTSTFATPAKSIPRNLQWTKT